MKGKSIAKIAVALAVIVLAALLALFGLKIPPISEVYGIKSLGAAIETGLELGGGYAAEYTAVGASAEELDAAVEIMRERLTAMGYDDATASRAGDNGIRIEFPDVTDAESLASMLGMAGHMQMLDSSGNVILDGSNVDSVSVGYTQDGYASVNFDFDDEGTEAFANATSSTYSGQSISLYLDDALVVSPQVSSQITDGNVSIPMGGSSSGISTRAALEDASSLVAVLQSGELPVSLELVQTQAIGAKLGENAASTMGIAAAAAMVLAIAVLVWRYRLAGAAAGVSLSLYMLISLYAVAIGGVRMTLAGAAGLLAGFALAVDANAILLDQFYREMAVGRTPHNAIRFAVKGAWGRMLTVDGAAFVVSVLVAYFCSGALASFATMLAIGALTALISAIWFTRSQMYAFCNLGGDRKGAFAR